MIKKPWFQTLLMAGMLLVVNLLVFHRSFDPNETLFSNDGPLGVQMNPSFATPDCFFGMWSDGSLLGYYLGTYSLSLGTIWRFLFGPLMLSKWLVPMCIWLSGVGGLVLGRRMGLSPLLAGAVGLATMLNNNTFSGGTWGLGGRCTMAACALLCVAAVWNAPGRGGWVRFALGGFCIGLGIIDSADVGAIYSVFLGLFVFFQAFASDGSLLTRALRGAARTALMAVCAGLISWQFITTLIDTNIKGVVGAEGAKDPAAAERQWEFATQWSTPKVDTLRVLIPGLLGNRIDTPDNQHYWGRVGQMAPWVTASPEEKAQLARMGGSRYNGSGEYAGILVVLGAAFAVFLALRRGEGTLTRTERIAALAWAGLAVAALLISWGRWAPFYRLVYALPYFHTIRNPMKFMHVLHLALQVLFCLGLTAMVRRYFKAPAPTPATAPAAAKARPAAGPVAKWLAGRTEKLWFAGLVAALGISIVGWLFYAASRGSVEKFILSEFAAGDPGAAAAMAGYSIAEVGWYVFFLIAAIAWFALAVSGKLAGSRAVWFGPLTAALVLVDLGRADAKWVYYYNFKQLYATNPMFETIRQQRLDNRVAFAMSQPRTQDEAGMMNILQGAYQQFWLHKAFPYHAILSLDISQMPRALQDYDRFMRGTNAALPINSPSAWPRLWEMTSTRWLFGLASAPDFLNQLDGGKGRFKLHTAFAYQPKPGVSQPRSVEDLDYVPQPGAPMGLIEFTGALPRVKLYSRWQVETNDDAALKLIASPGFNPQETVIVNDPIPASTPMAAPDAGTATIVTNVYKPTRLVVDATVKTPALLLVTDKVHEYWSVKVDGAPAKMLRCNYMLRGVRLEPGTHKVEFVLQPPIRSQWLNLAGIAATLAMVGYLMGSKPRA